ncbi:hypothetical protein O166_09970 [Pseudogulbenkiania ferrooxidans EGD-HP2]|uniref:Uncharacterized protein n=1 Tax=Pseudogulbenkiania ferrooxidans EGD-HP2 TaxID=1388764 RepID=A0ABN0N5A5_9NEIS|nr:hypothetical protein O166_09970 [Pseudogulbenkiania ferrooxidans EGD-HP2]
MMGDGLFHPAIKSYESYLIKKSFDAELYKEAILVDLLFLLKW